MRTFKIIDTRSMTASWNFAPDETWEVNDDTTLSHVVIAYAAKHRISEHRVIAVEVKP